MTRKPYAPPTLREVGQVDIDRVKGFDDYKAAAALADGRARPLFLDDLPTRFGLKPRTPLVCWVHFFDENDRDVWIGTPSVVDEHTATGAVGLFVLVTREVVGGFWTAVGGEGEAAAAAVKLDLPAVPIGTLDRLAQIRRDAPGAVPAPNGPPPLALLVPGASDNGTRLHGTLQAAEEWIESRLNRGGA